jgi:hypothetical protein
VDDGLKYALCALSFFRGRHEGRLRYKAAKGKKRLERVSAYDTDVRMARRYIMLARQTGFRGSVREALGVPSRVTDNGC